VRYQWLRADGLVISFLSNVRFVGSVVGLAVGHTAETIAVSGFGGRVFNTTPTTVFFRLVTVVFHSVILSSSRVAELIVALFLP